mgnify:FL=1
MLEVIFMSANEMDYNELYGNINASMEGVTMAKCNCTACNSCSCGRCERCISQCTGCRSGFLADELEWEVA